MKILHILDHSLPLHSGYTFRSQNIFRSQRKMGFDPVVLTSPKHEQSWKGESPEKEQINDFVYYRSGAVAGNGHFPFGYELKTVKSLTKRLKEIVDKEKPDIIHAHSPFLNGMAALNVATKLGIPVVYEIRAFWEDAAVDHGTFKENSIKYRLIKAMETRVCRKASHIAVLCNGLRKDLIDRGIPEDKITPVFNGVNAEDFKPCQPDKEFQAEWNLYGKRVIGFIGSFYRYEGLDLLIKAFHRIADKFPDSVLLLVGGGEMEAELKQLARQLDSHAARQLKDQPPSGIAAQPPIRPAAQPPSGIAAQPFGPNVSQALSRPAAQPPSRPAVMPSSCDAAQLPSRPAAQPFSSRVIFPGRVPHEQIPGIYSLVDILAYPRYSMRLTELVTPLKPLEAMAMGKPLVASDVGGHRELIQDRETGLLFEAGNLPSLTESLVRLLENKGLREKIQNHAYRWVRNERVWEKSTNVYPNIYRETLKI